MLQSARRCWLARLGMTWLAMLLLLAVTASVQRQRELSAVQRHCIAGISAYAEQGLGEAWDYIHPWQGYSIYLIENGRRKPELLRLLLLAEARRVDPGSYMHSYSKNYDLRLHLMESVMQQYRDDPPVHWAAGVCHMNACEFGEAAQELQRAMELGLDGEGNGIGRQHVLIRIMLAAAMEGDPTETLHWVRDTQLGDDEELQGLYADMLSRLYRYEECIDWLVEMEASDHSLEFLLSKSGEALLRALWWSGRYEEYRIALSGQEARMYPEDWTGDDSTQGHLGLDHLLPRETARLQLLDYFADSTGPEDLWESDLVHNPELLAEAYAFSGNLAFKEVLVKSRDDIANILDNSDMSWGEQHEFFIQLDHLYAQLIRAEVLRNDWEAVSIALDYESEHYIWPIPTELPTARFLLAVVNGKDVPELTQLLRQCIRVAPFIFHSPEYSAACADSGRDPLVLQRSIVRELARPSDPDSSYWEGAQMYYDYSNGELDW